MAVLSACSPSTPEERGIEVNHDIYKVYNQDKAMLFTEGLFEERYGIRVDDLFEATTVYWSDSRCPYHDDFAVVYRDQCHYGRMWSCDEMYVAVVDSPPTMTCGTALLHEFGHCLHMSYIGDGDPNHDDHEFWDIIKEAQDYACLEKW